MVLTQPFVQHSNTLVDYGDSLIGFLSENALYIDLAADFVADLIRDTIEQILHFLISLVNMAGDGPNKLKAIEKRGKGLLNDWKLATGKVFKLPLQSSEELHEVLSLGMLFLEISILTLKELHAPTISSSAPLILNFLYYLF